MSLVENYLRTLQENHRLGVAETSSYGVLETLLSEIDKTLTPRVRCVIHPKSQGVGLPDGGLFTADQLRDVPLTDAFRQLPSRGAMEIKGTKDDVISIAKSEQVTHYLSVYGVVLVTNYRDFLIVAKDADGTITHRERYQLATSERDF